MTEEAEVKEATIDYMERHSSRLRKWRDDNLTMRDDFAAENTYKFSNLMISLNVAVLGAASFALTRLDSLSILSKTFSLSLVLPVIAIILELYYRNQVVDINRDASDKRSTFIIDMLKMSHGKFQNQPRTYQELRTIMMDLETAEGKGFDDINKWIRDSEPKLRIVRKIANGLILATLLSLIVIVFSEINVLGLDNF